MHNPDIKGVGAAPLLGAQPPKPPSHSYPRKVSNWVLSDLFFEKYANS
jgi:hypothetical protein